MSENIPQDPNKPISKEDFFRTLEAKFPSDKDLEKSEYDNLSEILKNAYEIRKTELDLYWKRATYFWGFLIATFAAHFAVVKEGNNSKFSENTKLIVICVGFIFSLAWYLVNRGSTYWLANWERIIDTIEGKIGKELYKLNLTNNGGWKFWTSYGHSVSRINIMVSLFVWMAWCGLLINAVLKHYGFDVPSFNGEWKFLPTLIGTIAVSGYLIFFTTSGLEEEYTFNKRKSEYKDVMDDKQKEEDKKAKKIVYASYLRATIIVAVTIIFSLAVKLLLFDLAEYKCVSLIGTAIPTLGTLGFLTWHAEVNTLGGESSPEKLNRNILAITYVVGIILFILGVPL